MHPMGSVLVLWRRERGLSQAALAAAAGLGRPYLSGIESGRRDVTLTMLRRLAAALGVTPGTLADGLPPRVAAGAFSRARLERIARAAAQGKADLAGADRAIAADLAHAMASRLRARQGRAGLKRGGRRAAAAAWLSLKATLAPDVLQSLIQRADEAAGHE